MLEPEYRNTLKDVHIEVEDKSGHKELFDSPKSVSEALSCSLSYVYRSIRQGRRIAGCKLRVLDRHDDERTWD